MDFIINSTWLLPFLVVLFVVVFLELWKSINQDRWNALIAQGHEMLIVWIREVKDITTQSGDKAAIEKMDRLDEILAGFNQEVQGDKMGIIRAIRIIFGNSSYYPDLRKAFKEALVIQSSGRVPQSEYLSIVSYYSFLVAHLSMSWISSLVFLFLDIIKWIAPERMINLAMMNDFYNAMEDTLADKKYQQEREAWLTKENKNDGR